LGYTGQLGALLRRWIDQRQRLRRRLRRHDLHVGALDRFFAETLSEIDKAHDWRFWCEFGGCSEALR
jgi:hypothetical protein